LNFSHLIFLILNAYFPRNAAFGQRLYFRGCGAGGARGGGIQWALRFASLHAQFGVYLLVAILASALKINLPTITGTMSVNSLFILIGDCSVEAGRGDGIALLGVIINCLWKPREIARAPRSRCIPSARRRTPGCFGFVSGIRPADFLGGGSGRRAVL
jgi:hypothetical protein